MSRSGSYLVNAVAQASGRVLAVGANLVSLILVARLLGTDAFGRYAFVMAYVGIACSLADLGTTSVFGRGLAQTPGRARGVYFGDFCILRGMIIVGATLLALAAAPLVKPEFMPLLLVGSLAVPVVATRFFDPLFQVCGRPVYTVATNAIYAVSLIAASVAILAWAKMSLLAFMVGWAVCNLLYTVSAIALAARLIRPQFEFDRERLRSLMILAAPLGVGALFYIVHTRVDTLLLGYLRPVREVGLYGAAFKLLDLGTIAATTLLWPLIPILSRSLGALAPDGLALARRIVEAVGVVALPVAATAPYVAGPVILALYGPAFIDAASVIGILAVVFVVLALCLAGVVINISAGRVQYDYWNTALAVVVNIALNLVLIPRFGIVGAAYATLVSHLCMFLVVHYHARRNVGQLFVPAFWVTVAGLNLALLGGLAASNASAHIVLVPAGLLVYALAVWRLRLLPIAFPRPARGAAGSEAPDARGGKPR